MNKWNWIKMGLKLIKVSILFMLVAMVQSNISNMVFNTKEDFDLNMTLGVIAMAEKEEEEKPHEVIVEENKQQSVSINKFSGDLTGYAADCPLCNGTLACKPSFKVYKNNVITYPDKTYGNVRIVASSKNLTCGSIIKFNAKSISNEPIYAIVLDRGVLGKNIDLLMPTEDAARKQVGRKKITYDVIRNGW